MSLSLNENIDLSVKEFLVEASNARQVEQENFKQGEKVLAKISELQVGLGKDAALIATTQQQANLEAQKKTIQIARAAGADPSIAGNEILQIAQEATKAQQDTRQYLKEYEDKQNLSIFSDPIQWVKNVFTIGDTYNRLEQSAKRAAVLTQQANNVNNLVQSSAQTQLALRESITQATVEANGRLVAAAYDLKAYEAQLEGLKYNSAGVNAALKTSGAMLDALYTQKNMINAEENMNRMFQSLEQNKKEFNWRQKMAEDEATAKQENREVEEISIRKINVGRGIMGYGPLSGGEIKSLVKFLGTGQRKDLDQFYELGDRMETTGMVMYGTNPYDAMETLKNANSSVIEAKEGMLKLWSEARDVLEKDPTYDPKDKEGTKSKFNKIVKQIFVKEYQTIKKDTLFSIDPKSFFGDPNDPTIKGIPDIMALPITQQVLLPVSRSGQSLEDPQTVLALGVAAVQKGDISSTDFANGISHIYRKGALLNSQFHNFTGMGMSIPDGGKKYQVNLGAFKGKLDLANPVELSRYLSQQLTKSKATEDFMKGPAFTPRSGVRF